VWVCLGGKGWGGGGAQCTLSESTPLDISAAVSSVPSASFILTPAPCTWSASSAPAAAAASTAPWRTSIAAAFTCAAPESARASRCPKSPNRDQPVRRAAAPPHATLAVSRDEPAQQTPRPA
jgi:type IV secretory pathway VirJ component